MQRIKKGDEIIVISGRDRGERGTVLRRVDAEHVVVEGVNRVKKHQRPNPMRGQTGGIVDKDLPIHVSNIALFNPATKKADRSGVKRLEEGRKVRIFKANGEQGEAEAMAKEQNTKEQKRHDPKAKHAGGDKPAQKPPQQQQQAKPKKDAP